MLFEKQKEDFESWIPEENMYRVKNWNNFGISGSTL